MKRHIEILAITIVMSLSAAQASLAEVSGSGAILSTYDERVTDRELLAQAFDDAKSSNAKLLDAGVMRDTRGQVWPFIAAVATFDLALASYFWGVYVPTVSAGGGGCMTCSWSALVAQH